MIAVCNEGVPVPEVFNVKVAVNEPVAPPSVAAAVPDSVTVAVSLSVILRVAVSEPATTEAPLSARR